MKVVRKLIVMQEQTFEGLLYLLPHHPLEHLKPVPLPRFVSSQAEIFPVCVDTD